MYMVFPKKENVCNMFLRNYIIIIFYFLCIAQSEEGLQRFQMEAHHAYACKLILGLCHLLPQLETQVVHGKIKPW